MMQRALNEFADERVPRDPDRPFLREDDEEELSLLRCIEAIDNACDRVKPQSMDRGMDDDGVLSCYVCFDPLELRDELWQCSCCHHVMHQKCFKQWRKASKRASCPMCRHVVPPSTEGLPTCCCVLAVFYGAVLSLAEAPKII